MCVPALAGSQNDQLLRQQEQQVIAAPSSGPHVSRSMFTTRISNDEPVSNLNEIETDFVKVFFFTELRNCLNCRFTHEWSFNGAPQFVVSGFSQWPIYKFWSFADLSASYTGTWTVKMVVEGQVFAEKSFTYYEPTEEQSGKQDIQQRIEVETLSECENNLRYFSDQSNKNPNEPYFKFMLKKWGDRCLN